MLDLKKEARLARSWWPACLAERKKDDLLKEVPDGTKSSAFWQEEIEQVVERAVAPNARTADLVSSRAGSRLAGHGPTANYAEALRIPEDLRRMPIPPLHLLRHSGHAQAKHVTNRFER